MVPSLHGALGEKHSSLMFQFIAELKQFEATLMKNNFLFSAQLVYVDYALLSVLGNVL